jgi:hypothetical protein
VSPGTWLDGGLSASLSGAAVVGVLVLAGDALRRVWKGGTTLNDHAVAVVVLACLGLYPFLALGARLAGVRSVLLELLLLAGVVGIWGLFYVLDQRREARSWEAALAWCSQVAYAFSLWAGLLVLVRAPVAVLAGWPVAWPGTALVLPLALAVWGTCWTALRRFQLRRLDLAVSGEGSVRVVQLSDLHASPIMRGHELRALVAQVARLEPDLVVVTGDLLMPFSEQEHGWLLDALARLRRLCPVVACPGNHDLPVSATLGDELAALDVEWLADRSLALTLGSDALPVEVLGLDFRWTDAAGHVAAVLPRWPRTDGISRLILVHDPRYFDHLPPRSAELVLSGHTHGGQVGLQMFGLKGSLLGIFGVRDHGRFDRAGMTLWVHAGSWLTGLPPRMGVAPELVLAVLHGTGPTRPAPRSSAR